MTQLGCLWAVKWKKTTQAEKEYAKMKQNKNSRLESGINISGKKNFGGGVQKGRGCVELCSICAQFFTLLNFADLRGQKEYFALPLKIKLCHFRQIWAAVLTHCGRGKLHVTARLRTHILCPQNIKGPLEKRPLTYAARAAAALACGGEDGPAGCCGTPLLCCRF